MKTLKTILSFPQAIISVTLAHVFMLTADLLAVITRGAYGIGDFSRLRQKMQQRSWEVMNEMLHPSKVGVTFRRNTKLPAHVVFLTKPVGIIEGRVGKNVVGSKVRMKVTAKCISVLWTEIGLDTADGEIHDG